MDLGETSSSSARKLINNGGDSPYKKYDANLLNIDFKNEPVDIMDCLLLNEPDVKCEPEYTDEGEQAEAKVLSDEKKINTLERVPGEKDINSPERIGTNMNNFHGNTNAENVFGISNYNLNTISSGQVPVIRQIVINGQTRTCVLVNNAQLKQSIMEGLETARKPASIVPSPNTINDNQNTQFTLHSMVNCSRCGRLVQMDNFREHIDSCPPRTLKTNSLKEKTAHKVDQNQTVQTTYNPVTGEVVSLDSNKTQLSYQNPVPNNNETVQNSQVVSGKKVNSNLHKLTHKNISPARIYQRFVPSSISPLGENTNFETSRTNGQSAQSKTDNDQNFQNSNFLLNSLPVSSPKIDGVSRNLKSQSSPSRIIQPQLDKTLNGNTTDTSLHQIKEISDEIRNMNAALYCNKCNFYSTSLILMDIHMKNHVDSSILTTLKNIITPNVQNIGAKRKINIESAESDRGTTSEYKVATISKNSVPRIIQDGLMMKTNNTDHINITGDVDNIVLNSVGSRSQELIKTAEHLKDNRSLLDMTTEQNQYERIEEFNRLGRNVSENQFLRVDKNVKGTKPSERFLKACNNSKTTNVNCETSGQYDKVAASSVRKSTLEGELAENTGVASSSPPRSIRTRSKSPIIVNKSERQTNSDIIFSSMPTRSKSFCAENSISEQWTMHFKPSQSVYRSGRNLQDNDQKIGSTQQVNDLQNTWLIHSTARDDSVLGRSRNKLVREENCSRQSLPDSAGLINSSDLNLDSSATNRPNLSRDNISKLSVNDSNGICETGNSNCQSDSKIHITSDNDEGPGDQEYSYNNLLLLQDNTFSCSICSFTTDKKRTLGDHERNHKKTKQAIFRCVYCSQRYTRYMLYLHIQTVHPGQKFQIRDELVKTTSDKTMHKCSTCWFSTTDRENLLLHMKEHPAETIVSKDASDSVKDDSDPLFICFACSFEASDQKQLKLHLANHAFKPVKRIDSLGAPIFSCDFCSYNSKKVNRAINHMGSHKINRQIRTCPQCDFKSTPNSLFYHFQKCRVTSKSTKILNNNPLSKGQTGQSRMAKSKMSTTKLAKSNLHTLFMPVVRSDDRGHQFFDCKICSYGCSSRKDIFMHLNSHKKNLPIMKCPNCNFKSTGHALKYHIKKCKKPKSSDCQNSGNKSSAGPVNPKISLSAKSNLHTLLKPVIRSDDRGHQLFDCKMCSYSCPSRRDIFRHIMSHKKNLPIIKCSNCNFKSTGIALKYHIKKCKKPTSLDCQNSGNKSSAGPVNPKISLLAKSNLHTPDKRVDDFGRPVFDCKMCSHWCRRPRDIIAHINSHKKNMPIIKCPNCTFKSIGLVAVRHIRTCKNPTSAKGQNIDYESGTGYVNSKISAKSKKLNKCLSFKPVKRINEPGGAWFDCKMCSYGCSRHRDMVCHINSHRRKFPIIKCPNCNFRSTSWALKSHMRKCTFAEIAPSKNKFDSKEDKYEAKKNKIDEKSLVVVKTKPKSLFKCTECSFFTSLRIKLKLHIRKRHLKTSTPVIKRALPQEFHCYRCSFSTNLRLKLNLHQKSCLAAKEQKITCNLCSFVAVNKGCYSKHRKCHAKHLPIKKCPQCTFKSTFYALKTHMQKSGHRTGDNANNKGIIAANSKHDKKDSKTSNSDSKKSIFQCSQCPYSTGLRIKLNFHTKKRHQQKATEHFTQVDKYQYQCNYCSYVSRRLGTCKAHTSTHLKYKLPIKKCQNCNYRSTFYALRSHFLDCKGDQINKIAVSSKCNKIGANTGLLSHEKSRSARDSQEELMVHNTQDISQEKSKTVKKNKVFTCKLCSYTNRISYNISRHMEAHRRGPILQCIHCSYRSTHQALSVHLSKCFDHIKSLKSKNDDEFSNARLNHPEEKNLEENDPVKMTKDNNPKSFKCQYCSFTSFWSYLIDRHTDSHTLLKLPVTQCGNCDFKSTPAALLAHANTCTGKPLTDEPSAKKSKLLENNLVNIPKTVKINKSRSKVKEFKARDNTQFDKLRKRKDNFKSEIQGQSIANVANSLKTCTVERKSLIVNIYLNNELNKGSANDTSPFSEKESSVDVSDV